MISRRVHAPTATAYHPEAERAYAEEVLREQVEEWSREDEQQQDEALAMAAPPVLTRIPSHAIAAA